jgi:hypothetical protein
VYALKKRFLGYVFLLATLLCVALWALYAQATPSASTFIRATGVATPAFYSHSLPLRHPTLLPAWMHFHLHPELGAYERGSFIQAGVRP